MTLHPSLVIVDQVDETEDLFLHDLRPLLRRRSDRHIIHALLVGRDQLAGVPIAEIQERYSLSDTEVARALDWIAGAGGFHADAELHLRRHADQRIRQALLIGRDLIDQYRPAEIRERHAVSKEDYELAMQWLTAAIAATPRA